MNEIQNQAILHQVRLERVENGIIQDVLNRLESANRQIAIELKKTAGVWTKKRYREIQKFLKEITEELKSKLNEDMTAREFLDYEIEAQINMYKKFGDINFIVPNKEQLISSVFFHPYTSNSTFANYIDSFGANYFNMWDSQVRNGYLNGITTKKIVDNVFGSIAKNAQVAHYGEIEPLKNSLIKNTRTALQSYAEIAREMVYEENKELISGYEWIATLDRRTCLVCGGLDGKVKEEIKDFGMRPPAHLQCRCIVLPKVKGMKDIEDTRASENGQVSSSTTYEQWLKNQSDEVQEEILGKFRYKQYKSGEKMTSFISDNRVLSIEEVKEKEK